MRCDIRGCEKECTKGAFVCTKISARDMRTGQIKPIDFFMVACEACVATGKYDTMGGIEIKGDELCDRTVAPSV
jgi:hypothetical protein